MAGLPFAAWASVFALVMAGSAAAGPQQRIMTLNDALAIAYQTNPQIGGEQAALRAADEGVSKANAGFRPTVTASGSYGLEYEHQNQSFGSIFQPKVTSGTVQPLTGQVVLTQPVYRGGRTAAEISKAKAQVRQERARLAGVEEQVLFDATQAYMDLVRDANIYEYQVDNVTALTKQRDDVQKEFKLKEVTRTDVAQAEARLAGAQAALAQAQGQLASSRAQFTQVIGRAPDLLEQSPAYPEMPRNLDDTIAAALKLNPGLVAARENERAAAYTVDDAVGAMQPEVNVQAEYAYSKDPLSALSFNNNLEQHIGAVIGQVSIPIYQGGADIATVKQSEQLHGQSQLQIIDAERQARQQAESSWKTFTAAEDAIKLNEAQVAADQLAYEGVQKEQKAGTRTVLDVLNAEQELLNAKVAVASAKRDAYVAAAQIMAAAGLLRAKPMGLKVKLYDESEHYDDATDWLGFGG